MCVSPECRYLKCEPIISEEVLLDQDFETDKSLIKIIRLESWEFDRNVVGMEEAGNE